VFVVFNAVLGEELLFRGLLRPRMRAVFGRRDWVANGVLFTVYHLHVAWVMPATLVEGIFLEAIRRGASRARGWGSSCTRSTVWADTTRSIWVKETALGTALNTSFFAQQMAVLSIVTGIALLLTGIGFLCSPPAYFGAASLLPPAPRPAPPALHLVVTSNRVPIYPYRAISGLSGPVRPSGNLRRRKKKTRRRSCSYFASRKALTKSPIEIGFDSTSCGVVVQ